MGEIKAVLSLQGVLIFIFYHQSGSCFARGLHNSGIKVVQVCKEVALYSSIKVVYFCRGTGRHIISLKEENP